MSLSEQNKQEYILTELDVLDGLITYAEREFFEDGNDQYRKLRRHAYGKTVVIKAEKKEHLLVFRLSSTPVTYPNAASGYATPHSPVGRLCSFLRPGDEGESPAWGEYRVLETRLFERFDGIYFEDNVRNFLRMNVDGELGKASITDLIKSRSQGGAPEPHVSEGHEKGDAIEETVPQDGGVGADTTGEPPKVELTHFIVVDDDDELGATGLELDDEDDETEPRGSQAEEYYGLSETFYVNRTREQDAIISRSPLGPMFVEGIAGSGKTSAALGRTKMLCDFNAANVPDEAEFREIVGDGVEYWSGQYAGQFSQESSIGFVRTGELIQYLQETCRRLDLSNLPIAEFKELQSRLRSHRRIERSGVKGRRWSGLPEPRGTHIDTTMEWLHAADHALGKYFAEQLPAAVPTAERVAALFDAEQQGKVLKLASAAINMLHQELRSLTARLQPSSPGVRFVLDRLALSVDAMIEKVRHRVLGREVVWCVDNAGAWLYSPNAHAMAALLTKRLIPLYLRSGARLVFVDANGPIDKNLTLLNSAGEILQWDEKIANLLSDGDLLVRDANGLAVPAVRSDQNDLHLRLLPEALGKPYVLRDGKLHSLRLVKGLGRERLKLHVTLEGSEEDESEELLEAQDDAQLPQADTPSLDPRLKSVDTVLARLMSQTLMKPLIFLADAYLATLQTTGDAYPNPVLARQIRDQLEHKKLADEDINLLLCLAHLVGRGFKKNPLPLSEPTFYQSVFIDEVQDFTEQQIYLMAEQARPEYRAITVVGDIAQKLHHGSQIDIPACFPGHDVPHVRLTENLRQLEAPGLAWFSECFRAELQDKVPELVPMGSLLQRFSKNPEAVKGPELEYCDDDDELKALVVDALKRVSRNQTAAVILPDIEGADRLYQQLRPVLAEQLIDAELSHRVELSRRYVRHFTSVLNAKGLEFDVVILPYLERYDLDDKTHINRLYVGVTRARQRLLMLSSDLMHPALEPVWTRYESVIAAL